MKTLEGAGCGKAAHESQWEAEIPATEINMAIPDEAGRFGRYGGAYVPETLMPAIRQLAAEYERAKRDPDFQQRLRHYLSDYAGRPSPLYFARRMTEALGGAKVYVKREDLTATGSHKINNTLGQGLLAVRMGKRRVIAETGAGQHGVATATAAALLGLECDVYMGEEDMRRQALNVFRMKILGARVVPVGTGSRTLKDATNDAFRDWMATVGHTHYVIGSVVGPHPFPLMVRDFQSVIGREAREQILAKENRLPDYLVACVGGGSNSAGLFYPFVGDERVKMVGVEAGGTGLSFGKHAASLTLGRPGILHGSLSYVLQDDDGQTLPVHSIAAGLDYPGVGPEHGYWKDTGRVEYVAATDEEALQAFEHFARHEGIIPALESAHAVAHVMRLAPKLPKEALIILNLSGSGDKDCFEVAEKLGAAVQGGPGASR